MVLIYVLVALLAVVVVGGLIMWTRGAASSTRRLGLPTAGEPAVMYRGDVMSRHLITSGMFARLEFFDWGVRLRGIAICRWLVPTWEARYDELARVDLIASRSRIAVWLRLRGEASGMAFLTHWSEDALRLLGEHGVPVNRSVAQVQRVEDLYHLPR